MKIIILVLTLTCSELIAQFNVTLTGGINYATVNSILFGRRYYNMYNQYYKYQIFENLGFEIIYKRRNYIFLTGMSYSYRGARDYYVVNAINPKGYDIDMAGYIEIPLQINYSYYKNKFEGGLGIILHKRVYDGVHYYDERNKLYGLDIRVSSSWNINRSLAIVPSYTFGNLDKYIANTYGNFIHHVFALNLRYTFLHFK